MICIPTLLDVKSAAPIPLSPFHCRMKSYLDILFRKKRMIVHIFNAGIVISYFQEFMIPIHKMKSILKIIGKIKIQIGTAVSQKH